MEAIAPRFGTAFANLLGPSDPCSTAVPPTHRGVAHVALIASDGQVWARRKAHGDYAGKCRDAIRDCPDIDDTFRALKKSWRLLPVGKGHF